MATQAKKPLTDKQRNTRILVIAAVVLVVLIVGGILGANAYSKYLSSGNSDRKLTSFKSEHYEVNNCMMTYYFYSDFYNVYNTYGSYFSAMGLDPTTSMKGQTYSDDRSWFEYFINTTASNVQGYLYYAEAALANDYTYDNLDSDVDAQIQNMQDAAEQNDITLDEYITKLFGTSVKESDIRDALNIQLFASAYSNQVESDFADAITTDDYDTYYGENAATIQKVDYRSYAITATVAEDADETAKAEAYTAAENTANELLAAAKEGDDAFAAWITTYLNEQNADLETPLTADEIAEKADAATTEATYTENDDFSTWAFDAARVAGDTTVIDNGSGTYTVYLIDAAPYRLEYTTKTVRHILIKPDSYESDDAAYAKAEEILAEWKSGDMTEDSFDALAKEYNEDSASLYKNIVKGKMVADFENWCYDDSRAAGDTEIIKTDYGYHIMYFVGDGIEEWQTEAQKGLITEKITALTQDWSTTYSVTYDSASIYALPDSIPASAFTQSTDTTAADTSADTTTEDTTSSDTSDNTHA